MMAVGSPGRGLSGARWVGRVGAEGAATVGPGWNGGAVIVLAGVGSGSRRAGAAREGAGASAGGAGGSGAPAEAVPLLVVLAAGAGRRSASFTSRATGVVVPVRPGGAAEPAVGAGVVVPVRPGDAAESAVGAGVVVPVRPGDAAESAVGAGVVVPVRPGDAAESAVGAGVVVPVRPGDAAESAVGAGVVVPVRPGGAAEPAVGAGVVLPVRPGDAAESAVGAGVVVPVRPGDAAESAVGARGGGETGGVGRTGGWRLAPWLEGRALDMPELAGGTTGDGLGTTGAEGAVTTTAECTGTGTGRGVLRLGYRWNQARTALPTTTIGRPASAQDRAHGRLGRAGEAAVAGGGATSRGAASASVRRWHAASQRSFRIEVGSVGLRMGSRSSILETRPSTAGGSPGCRSRSCLSGDRSCRSRTSSDVVPSNGTRPHRSSWRRTPNRYTTLRSVAGSPASSSGDAYRGSRSAASAAASWSARPSCRRTSTSDRRSLTRSASATTMSAGARGRSRRPMFRAASSASPIRVASSSARAVRARASA